MESTAAIAGRPLQPLSEQLIVDCVKEGSNGCNGGWYIKAYTWVTQNGIVGDQIMPYAEKEGPNCPSMNGMVFPIDGYADVPVDEEELKTVGNQGDVHCVSAPCRGACGHQSSKQPWLQQGLSLHAGCWQVHVSLPCKTLRRCAVPPTSSHLFSHCVTWCHWKSDTKVPAHTTCVLQINPLGRWPLLCVLCAVLQAVCNGPVAIAVHVNDEFMAYKSGIFSGPCSSDKADANHAVVVVGYGRDESGQE